MVHNIATLKRKKKTFTTGHIQHFPPKVLFSFSLLMFVLKVTAVAQWLRCCVTNPKVAGSIPAGFIDIKSFRSHYGPGVDSASNRNEYQEYFLRVKPAGT